MSASLSFKIGMINLRSPSVVPHSYLNEQDSPAEQSCSRHKKRIHHKDAEYEAFRVFFDQKLFTPRSQRLRGETSSCEFCLIDTRGPSVIDRRWSRSISIRRCKAHENFRFVGGVGRLYSSCRSFCFSFCFSGPVRPCMRRCRKKYRSRSRPSASTRCPGLLPRRRASLRSMESTSTLSSLEHRP